MNDAMLDIFEKVLLEVLEEEDNCDPLEAVKVQYLKGSLHVLICLMERSHKDMEHSGMAGRFSFQHNRLTNLIYIAKRGEV